jgi:hypothetical protein
MKRLKAQYVAIGMNDKAAKERARMDCLATTTAEYQRSCVDVLRSDLVPRAWIEYGAVSNKSESTSTLARELLLTRV